MVPLGTNTQCCGFSRHFATHLRCVMKLTATLALSADRADTTNNKQVTVSSYLSVQQGAFFDSA